MLRQILNEFNAADISMDPTLLYRAEFVVVGDGGLRDLSDGLRDAFDEWERSELRKPLLWFGSDRDGAPKRQGGATIVTARGWVTPQPDAEEPSYTVGTTFDHMVWSPAARPTVEEVLALDGSDGSRIHEHDESVWISGQADLESPWMLAAAAAGLPFIGDASLVPSGTAPFGTEILKAAAALRRKVYSQSPPWMVASGILDHVGLAHRPALPLVTGVLLSNREDHIASAIEGFGRQTYTNLELVVGCHGFPAVVIEEALARLPDNLSVTVHEFSSKHSLGRCLNTAIETSSGAILAKIDDDDHYGPAYIEDSVQAMFYSGSPLVGKRAAHTYLESDDRTYLRRPDIVERFFDGFPIGATLVFERGLWEQVGFPDRTVGEDSALTAAAKRMGIEPYSSSQWEFVYRRSVDGNTWAASDVVFTEGSVVAWEGDDPQRADVTSS
jgi:hypothetical protein